VSIAAAQDAPKQLTARELFYHAGPAAAAKASDPAPAPAKNAVIASAKPPVKRIPTAQPKPTPTPTPSAPSTLPDNGRVVQAALVTAPAPANGSALGLRYTILKKTPNGMTEVDKNTVFHAGDKIQLSVQTNSPGYLYVVNRGSSGAWKP